MSRSILVTGGAGFIGSALAEALLRRGDSVTVTDNLSTGYRANVPTACRFIEMDMANREHYTRLDALKFDAVLHLAAQSSGEASFLDPWSDFNSHATATFLLLNYCRAKSVNRFLYASSMAVYGDPEYLPVDEAHPTRPKSYYGAGKLAAESYTRLHDTLGMSTTVFRMFSVYGPNQNLANQMQGMASIFLSYILEDRPITVKGSRERFRDFVYIDDVVDAWLGALDNDATRGRTYNLCTGNRTTVETLLDCLTAATEKPEYPIEFTGGTPGDQFGVTGSAERLRTDTGWAPRWPLVDGVGAMVSAATPSGGGR